MSNPHIDIPPLTEREERFILEYPACNYNAAEAAIKAGYSPKNARKSGYQVLKKIKPLLEARQQAKQQQAQELVEAASAPPVPRSVAAIATLEQSLQLCTALAFYDPRKLYEGDNLKPQSKLTRREALMVADFQVEENFVGVGEKAVHVGYTKKVKLVDRAPYLNMLLKWHRAFPTGAKEQPKAPAPAEVDFSNWTTEDFEAYQKLKAKLTPTVIDANSKPSTP